MGGAGGAAAGSSGLPGSKTLSSLTTAEKGQYCDWDASLWGGYNQTKSCPGNADATNPTDRAACLMDFPNNCAATVSQFETCSKKIAADPCNLFTIVLTAPECAPVSGC